MMGFAQCQSTNLITQSPLLQPVLITDDDQAKAKPCVMFHSNQDIVFTHAFIKNEIEKYNLTLEGCDKCSPITRHFVDPKALIDHLAINKIIWVCFPQSILRNPAPQLNLPLWDPENINIQLNKSRPRGFIQVTRFAKEVTNANEFIKMGKSATLSILKSLKTRPLAVAEIQYKLNTDLDDQVLISLKDFLNQKDVKKGNYPTQCSQALTCGRIDIGLQSI